MAPLSLRMTGDQLRTEVRVLCMSSWPARIPALLLSGSASQGAALLLAALYPVVRCHPRIDAPKGWDIWHSDNHWSNEETM